MADKIDNSRAWILATVFGIAGILLSAILFVFITWKTGYILGLVAIICGAISGGAAGLGFKLAQGKIATKEGVMVFIWSLAFFGLMGMLAAYFGPYLLFASKGISFTTYLSLISFDAKDIVFIMIGSFGGRWAGSRIARSIIITQLMRRQAGKSEGQKSQDL